MTQPDSPRLTQRLSEQGRGGRQALPLLQCASTSYTAATHCPLPETPGHRKAGRTHHKGKRFAQSLTAHCGKDSDTESRLLTQHSSSGVCQL